MGIIKKLVQYINMDVQNENENKQFAVALRLLSMSNVLLYFILGVLFGITGSSILLVFGFVSILGYLAVFYVTYHDATRLALVIYISMVICDVLIFTCFLGWETGFQYYLIGTIILVFFTYFKKGYIKFVYSISIAMLFWILHDLFLYRETSSFNTESIRSICSGINIFHLFIQLSIISYYLSGQSIQVEQKLIRYNERLKLQASMDPLTNILNRRSMMEYLRKVLVNYCINREPFCIAIGDIDFFKKVNDTYGHECGDIVLKELADLITKFIKEKGNVSR